MNVGKFIAELFIDESFFFDDAVVRLHQGTRHSIDSNDFSFQFFNLVTCFGGYNVKHTNVQSNSSFDDIFG